ncbi:MAG: 2OG-Fe(II) oxygenase [Bacteriovoracales bacterium]|nr:2OG-Fe(II) oxygenase [Bacteriovoracales bacterium]
MDESIKKTEQDTRQKKIEDFLAQMMGQGSFATEIVSELSNLKMSVEDVGELKFPIDRAQAKELVKHASYAPFGRREKTITDLSIRNVWEIKKSKIKIDNRSWNKTLGPIINQIQGELGFPPGKVKAKLDKLLIYEKGQFFAPHQDSEKENGMLGGLIVVLPSKHKGGALVVSHQGKNKVYQVRSKNSDKLNFFAFYSDCQHEIKKVTSGYRIALSYNLSIGPSYRDHDSHFKHHNDKLENAIKDHFSASIRPRPYEKNKIEKGKKFVYFLDHQYTPSGLSPFTLKNGDYLKFEALREIAGNLGLNIFVALAKIHECWSCDVDDFSYGDSYRRRYRNRYDDEEEEERVHENYKLDDLVDGSTNLDHWKSLTGEPLFYGEIWARDEEIFMTKPTDAFDFFESEYQGWMGNYGNTLDRWYHRAAIVLWTKKDHFSGVSGIGPEYLISITKEALINSNRDDLRKTLRLWEDSSYLIEGKELFGDVLTLVKKVEDSKLAKKMLKNFTIQDFKSKYVDEFLEISELYGKAWSLDILKFWHKGVRNEEILDSNKYALALIEQISSKWNKAVEFVTQINVDAYIKSCNRDKRHWKSIPLISNEGERTYRVSRLLEICYMGNNYKCYKELIRFLCSEKDLFSCESLNTILQKLNDMDGVANLKNIGSTKISDCLLIRLEEFLNNGMRKKNDWSIGVKVPCTCTDCKQLKSFLRSQEKSIHLPMAKERRKHLHREIEKLRIYISHETLRKGSPHILVLKKLPRLFTEEEKVFNNRKKIFMRLKSKKKVISSSF